MNLVNKIKSSPKSPSSPFNMHKCSRFRLCSVPLCPLDHEMDNRDKFRGEPGCPLSKTKRYALGAGLPMHGLTKKEWAAKLNWDKKSLQEKEKVRKRLKQHSFSQKAEN